MFLQHLACNRHVLSPVENEKVNCTEHCAPKPHYLMREGERDNRYCKQDYKHSKRRKRDWLISMRGRGAPLSNHCSRPCVSLSPSSSLAQATWEDGSMTSSNKRQVIAPNRAERGSNTEDGTEKEQSRQAVPWSTSSPGGQSDPSLEDADSHLRKTVRPFLHFHQETSLLPILKI